MSKQDRRRPVYDPLFPRPPSGSFRPLTAPPTHFTVGEHNVFLGPQAVSSYPPAYLQALVSFWQERFPQAQPVSLFFNIHGTSSPAMQAILAGINTSADPNRGREIFDILMGPEGRVIAQAEEVRDREGRVIAGALSVPTDRQVRSGFFNVLGVRPERHPFTPQESLLLAMAHEMGHIGTTTDGQSFRNELIADRFAAEFMERNPEFFPSISREYLQQIRSVAAMHNSSRAFLLGATSPTSAVSMFALRPGSYQDIQDLSASPDQATINGLTDGILNRAIGRQDAQQPLTAAQQAILSDPRVLARRIQALNSSQAFAGDET
jgi:hypothetical protein